jgi:hypothetical protein
MDVSVKLKLDKPVTETNGEFSVDVNRKATFDSVTPMVVNDGTDTICNIGFIIDDVEILKDAFKILVFLVLPIE